ncbi:hypothetical protein HKX48_007393 [Thoreauomyces humboldtii]|nr:hypothetical protein HKX48_007393 [Thoreauomyces humboldtii]
MSGTSPNSSSANMYNKSVSTLEARNAAVKEGRETAAEAMSRANAWAALCSKVLPLFNGQGLKGHMEDMNALVGAWLGDLGESAVVEDLNELFTTGLLTLSSKLAVVGDEVLASRVVEVWTFYFGTVVPYLQGVFLPIRTLWRSSSSSSSGGPTSGGGGGGGGGGGNDQSTRTVPDLPPDVRTIALLSFRDHILIPLAHRMQDSFPRLSADIENGRKVNETASRLMQMLSIMSGLPATQATHKTVVDVLQSFKQSMTGSKSENRNSMALYGARVHATS